ncbi:MAG: hypothetical protein JSW23_10305 [Planctomycetota bacterium]|nr:MAG: hypothetical protein JSW23_10305 [Planctomycetota bacterium]
MVCSKNWFLGDNTVSDDIEKEQTKAKLESLSKLIDRYAQSRVLPLLIPLAILALNAVLLLSAGELAGLLIYTLQVEMYWFTVILWAVIVWVLVSSTWLTGRLVKRYGSSFYKKEGVIELQEERVPIWVWITYVVTVLGPTFLSAFGIMPIRWALALALTSFGLFMLCVGKKHKEKALGAVLGGLCLAQAGLTAIGVRIPFADEDWVHAYFVTLMAYIVVNGLITAVAVHIYNRVMLRKIKELRLASERETNTSDS